MQNWILVSFLVSLVGCMSPQSVKMASTKMTATLLEVHQAQKTMRDLYLMEIDETRRVVEEAMLAQRTTKVVRSLTDEEANGDFIEISKEISEARKKLRDTIAMFVQSDAQTIDDFLKSEAAKFRASAVEIESTKPQLAARLRNQAQHLESGGRPQDWDPDVETGLQVLVELKAMKSEAAAGLANLERHLTVIQKIHAVIDDWIQTEVTVDGAKIATVIKNNARVPGSGAAMGDKQ
ncbi:hypothetical protein NKDENANG_00552 [Candidatus Entotheonellaceae bacterium PAL068K]